MVHLDPSEGSRHIKDWGLGDIRGGYRISEKREGGRGVVRILVKILKYNGFTCI